MAVTALAFHPSDPSLLAGGSFNGDVLLWRLTTAREHRPNAESSHARAARMVLRSLSRVEPSPHTALMVRRSLGRGEQGQAGRIDPLVGKSVLTNYTHHEPVQQLAWTRDPHRALAVGGANADGYVLASVTEPDGRP